MKKSLFSFILALLLLNLMMVGLGQSSYAEEGVSFANKNVKNAEGIKVLVSGGIPLEFDTPIKISEGRTLVPMRKIAEAFQYEVNYEAEDKRIIMSLNETYVIEMKVGDNRVFVKKSEENTQGSYILERQPEIYEGRTYVPLRAISELFGCIVDWDAKTKTIHIYRVLGHGGDFELESKEGVVPPYRYYGQVLEGKPNGSGVLHFGYEQSSYFRGEFRKGVPNGTGVMNYMTGKGLYCIMGSFKDGRLVDGSALTGPDTFSFIKDGKVDATYTMRDGHYVKIESDPDLNEDWFKAIQSEVSALK